MTTTAKLPATAPFWGTDAHRAYLTQDAKRQFDFFARGLDSRGGFAPQSMNGAPIKDAPRELHATTRMVHSFALGQLAGRGDGATMVDHGMAALRDCHRDARHGGYAWSFDADGRVQDGQKLAYGHAFVLLAGASAKMAGHPEADALIADVMEVIDRHFWDSGLGRMREEYAQDWHPISQYRGMNANMHSIEAFLTAFEATGEREFLDRALSIVDFFVAKIGASHGWRLPEHFTEDWKVDPTYEGNPMFRPAGTTPGHSLELSRLLLQAWDLSGRSRSDLLLWSEALYTRALSDAWDADLGGFIYTVAADGTPLRRSRYWWPLTEAIGAAAARLKCDPQEITEAQYLQFWQTADALFIDRMQGGWIPEVGPDNLPDDRQFTGKPDIYHSIQAALFPLVPQLSYQARALAELGLDLN
ncbi:AGE family epimerase/isomerase [Thioclava sp. BHET1]|nr:AGE family epimerase/isomerase [Thioclava sp. BHET1]